MASAFGGSVALSRPIEEVFSFLTDPSRDTGWRRPHVLGSRMLTQGPVGVGTRYETVSRFLGRTGPVVTEITACEPPTLLSWKQVNEAPFVADGSYRLEPADGGTRFTLQLLGEGRGALRPFERAFVLYQQRVVIPRFLRQLREALA